LRHHQPERMRQIPREDCNQRARNCHIAECNPLKRSTRSPRFDKFILQSFRSFLREGVVRTRVRPSENRFTYKKLFVFLHRAFSTTIFVKFDFPLLARRHSRAFQPRRFATARKPSSGFTAKGFPTLLSIHRSSAPSPYAAHSARCSCHFSAYQR